MKNNGRKMTSINDASKRLKSIVNLLQRHVECPVCLNAIKPPFTLCMRGHAVCFRCETKLEKCPICQEEFILENPVFMRKVLEALPRLCCYSDDGCDEVVEQGNDHETFCGYRPIVCRATGCSATEPLVKFLSHLKICHPEWTIRRTEGQILYSTPEFEDTQTCRHITYMPVYVFDNLFWILIMIDVKEKQLNVFFRATPVGTLEHDYYARLTLKKENLVYTYSIKAIPFSSCDRKVQNEEGGHSDEMKLASELYCMKIPLSELCHLIEDNGSLQFEFLFFKM